MITKEQVLDALSNVIEPDLGKDLVTLNMIEDVQIEGNHVSFTVVLTTPACPLKDLIHNACVNAIKHFVSQEADVTVNMTSRVTTKKKDEGNTLSGVKNIIAIASGKGGVGKSTVSSNLAVALAKQGAKVGLIDADIYGPSVPIMFDVEHERPLGREVNGKNLIIPIESYGVKLLSIGFFADTSQAIAWRGPMATSALKQMFNDADWGDLDYLLIDLPPGTGDVHLTLVSSIPVTGAVVVSTPQRIALADAQRGVAMFAMGQTPIPVLGMVENMAYFTPAELPNNKYYIFGESGARNLAERLEVPFLGEIPLVQSIREAGDAGRPAVLQDGTAISKAFEQLAQNVAQQVAIQNAKATQEALA